MKNMVIAGGGIGGLAAALACARAGAEIDVHERSIEFSEFGAGIQLSPNVVKILYDWGLQDALADVAVFPDRLQVRSALSGAQLGVLALGDSICKRYGTPYLTIHRADMHQLLLQAVQKQGKVQLHLNSPVLGLNQTDEQLDVKLAAGASLQAQLLVAADGGWSSLRQQVLDDGKPQPTGHLAYRALLSQARLPVHLRSTQVTAWLGQQQHVIAYPVRRGELLNVVAIVHGQIQGDLAHWDHSGNAVELQQRMQGVSKPLFDLIQAVGSWRLWPLSIRPPMSGAHQHAQGRVAFLGDAAHPMVPYLAQGAGMAIEDAATLAKVLGQGGAFASPEENASAVAVPALLQRYAEQRWRRNARVQRQAIRNGKIFHAAGPLRWGRDAAMKLLGEGLLDQPWLYAGA
jgi:salicylate hydroxylase